MTETRYPNSTHFSPNFSKRELECKCGCETPAVIYHNLAALALELEKLRAAVGHPISVVSGFRCAKHNLAVGGKSQSQHLSGKAADLVCKAMSPAEVKKKAEAHPPFRNGGIGLYPTFTHVDLGPGPRRW
ncbi:MAG: D-Ala-D-Ala carboxypeptidase family metallohydrolase [Rhodospirillaceae bacterium]